MREVDAIAEAKDMELARMMLAGEADDEETMDVAEAFDVIGLDPHSMTPGTIALCEAAWTSRERILRREAANDDGAHALSA